MPAMPPPVPSTVVRSLNSAFQISTNRAALASYSVDIASTISLTSGESGSVIFEQADDAAFTQNVQTIQASKNQNTGTLTIGLNLTQTVTATVTGLLPAGKWARLRTVNNTGTPTFTYISGQETLVM